LSQDDLRVLVTLPNEVAAAMVLGRLEQAGIGCLVQPSMGTLGAAWCSRTVYVQGADLESGRAAIAAQAD
jgi:hypothetical protein